MYYFFFCATLCAQVIKGDILDKESKKSIPYVSIGIINTSQGTYAYTNGQFEMELAEYKDADSLRFSCIGYKPVTYSVIEFIELYNTGLDTIFLIKKVTELEEVVIEGTRTKPKKMGNKTSNKHIVFGYLKDMEGGIVIKNDKELFLKSVSFRLTMSDGAAPDSAIYRFNIYSLKNNLPDNIILKQPIYFHLKSDQFEGKNVFDLSKYNINVNQNFAATFELIKQYGGGQIFFTGWIDGNPSVFRIGAQGKWVEARSDKKDTGDNNGMKLHQYMVIEVLYEK